MPKTFTSDVGAALPSAIDGPFQIQVPGDGTSYFKIDPAGGKIEAAGVARPVRRLLVPFSRNTGVVGTSTFDTGMDARTVGATADGGFMLVPFVVPAEIDVSAASSVIVAVAPGGNGGDAVVRFELSTTFAKDGDTTLTTEVLNFDWTTPSGWSTGDMKLVTLDGGSGATFAANKFEPGDVVGFLLRRLGAATEDTMPVTLLMAPGVVFEYVGKRV